MSDPVTRGGTPEAPASLHVTLRDGVRLHARRAGRGPALLLLHGFTGSAATWAPFLPPLAERHDVVAMDLLGHGASDRPRDPARHAAARVVDDLAALLDAIGVARAAVLGYSMGGRLALHFALAHPERVTALVLESASAGIVDADERRERAGADARLAADLERDGILAFVARWERLPLWASQASLPAATRERLRAQRLANDPAALAASLRGAGAGVTPPAHDRLGALRAPTLVVAGALDAKYAGLARELAAAIPDARALVVPEAGHAVHLEQPAAFERAVLAFLDAIADRPRAA